MSKGRHEMVYGPETGHYSTEYPGGALTMLNPTQLLQAFMFYSILHFLENWKIYYCV